jgi:hypothetical protein
MVDKPSRAKRKGTVKTIVWGSIAKTTQLRAREADLEEEGASKCAIGHLGSGSAAITTATLVFIPPISIALGHVSPSGST